MRVFITGRRLGVMNADRYSRVTLVLHRATDEGLSALSRRLRVSKSELVREVLEEPVQAMLGLLDRHPEGTEIDPRQLALDGLQLGDELITEARSKLLGVANG